MIIILGGGNKGHMEKNAELHHKDYADYIVIISTSSSLYAQSTELAINLGIPGEVIIEEHDANITYLMPYIL